VNPDALRKEAAAAEFLAKLVSYGRDKERLTARAAELRAQAEALEGKPIDKTAGAKHGGQGAA
jgi:hypothetical protein